MGLHHSPNAVTNGLVMYLDAGNPRSYSGTGTTWADLSGNALNGTLFNSPTFNTSGHFSFANSSTQIVSFSNSSRFHFLGKSQCSFELWLRLTSPPGYQTYKRIFDRESNPGGGRDGYNFLIDNSLDGTNITFSFERWSNGAGAGGTQYTVTQTSISNLWIHWTIIVDGLRSYIYRNGSLVSTSGSALLDITNTVASLDLANQGGAASIGGDMSMFKVYNVALSADSVKQNFNATRSRYGI